MRKDSTPLTAADLDNIVTENFAPELRSLRMKLGPIFTILMRWRRSARVLPQAMAGASYGK